MSTRLSIRVLIFIPLKFIALVLLLNSCARPAPVLHSSSPETGFGLTVHAGQSAAGLGQGTFSLLILPAPGGELAAEVSVHGARSLKAAYFSVGYDASRFTPRRCEPGPALGRADELLTLVDTAIAGQVDCGQCLANWDQRAGFSGTGLVAKLYFARRPFLAPVRSASDPPDSVLSRTTLSWDEPSATLSWRFYNQGDYDQNGEVNIADLTPLGLYFGQACSYPADEDCARACADGDHNGELNVADITPIGSNFGKDMLNGWNIYSSADAAQYPSSASDDNGTAVFLGFKLLGEHDPGTAPASDRLRYVYTVAGPVAGDVYWVRPVDTAFAEGIASNYAPGGGSANHPPVINGVVCYSDPVASGGYQLFVVDATDADGDPLWTVGLSDADVIWAGTSPGNPLQCTMQLPEVSSEETRTITLRVSDGNGGEDTVEFVSHITPPLAGNSAPVISSVTVIPDPVVSGGTCSVTCNASDVDGDTLAYFWAASESDIDHTGNPVALYAPVTASDTYVSLRVFVDDGHGHWAYDTSTIVEVTAGGGNQPPVASLTADPLVGPAPLTVNFDASGSTDGDGSIVSYDWDWNGDSVIDLPDGGATPVHQYAETGTYITRVCVRDDDGAEDTAEVNISVEAGNHNPEILLLVRSAEFMASGSVSAWWISAADTDGDPLTHWLVTPPEVLVGPGDERPDSFVIIAPVIAESTSYTIQVMVSDGRGGSASLDVQQQVLAPEPGNTAPYVSEITAYPAPVPSGGTSTVSCVAGDAEETNLQYTITSDLGECWLGSPGDYWINYHAPEVAVDTWVLLAVHVDDGHGNYASEVFNLLVTAP